MTIDVFVGIVGTTAAVAVSQWPKIAPFFKRSPKPPAVAGAVTYQQALEALAVVRARLVASGGVAAEPQKAIETLTLALVAGSDR